jgi:hypothetical protein
MKRSCLSFIIALIGLSQPSDALPAEPFAVVDQGGAKCVVVLDLRGSTLSQERLQAEAKGVTYGGGDAYSIVFWGRFLAERIRAATGAELEVRLDPAGENRAIVISLAENYPGIARSAGLDFEARKADPVKHYDAFCIQSSSNRLYLLGHTELGCRHAVATLLEHWGFRFYSPSPRWWIAPRTNTLAVNLVMTKAPVFFNVDFGTNAGHHMNHGNGTETYLWDIQEIWYAMNRTAGMRFNPGPRFSAGPFAFNFTRNVKAELDEHPEYFAMTKEGKRDTGKPLASRALCVSNRRMVELIVQDRLALFEAQRKKDRFRPMVSAEYSGSGFGCHCPDCVKLGGPEEQKFVLVNEIARAVRKAYPDAFVALRLVGVNVPSIEIEKNVCVGVSREEFVPAWAEKVEFVGSSFAAPPYVPGHRKDKGRQISYYSQVIQWALDNHVKSLSASLAPAWGGLQTPLLYMATRLFWDPAVDTNVLFQEYFDLAFGKASGSMRAFWKKLQGLPDPDDAQVATMLEDLAKAYEAEDREDVQKRVVDVMAYMHGLILYRNFEVAKEKEGENRTDAFYNALLPLMTFLARNSYRNMMCPSVLAQSYCQQETLKDGREDFYWYRYEKLKPPRDPIWMDPELPWRARPVVVKRGDPRVDASFHDDEILQLFHDDHRQFSPEPDKQNKKRGAK